MLNSLSSYFMFRVITGEIMGFGNLNLKFFISAALVESKHGNLLCLFLWQFFFSYILQEIKKEK